MVIKCPSCRRAYEYDEAIQLREPTEHGDCHKFQCANEECSTILVLRVLVNVVERMENVPSLKLEMDGNDLAHLVNECWTTPISETAAQWLEAYGVPLR